MDLTSHNANRTALIDAPTIALAPSLARRGDIDHTPIAVLRGELE